MYVLDDLTRADLSRDTVLTIGIFDGVHRGHQALIREVVAQARAHERLAALITFHPHPAGVLAPERAPRVLTMPGEKLALLEALGVDLVVLLPFDEALASVSAEEFVRLVAHHLRPRELWVGPDFALGRNRGGNLGRLRELGQQHGYCLHVVELASSGDGSEPISSSRIRDLLGKGMMREAAFLLGRYASVSGEVIRGARRGHSLGFPTANLAVHPARAVPANGVYAVWARLGEARYAAVANVGVRPSFDNGPRTVETHILGLDEELYGCDLTVEFVSRLRDERRFDDLNDLSAQIRADMQSAREILVAEAVQFERPPEPGTQGLGACPYHYEEVDHTADRALRVWAQRAPDLYVAAARGMYRLMANLHGLTAMHWREVQLRALDRESLLVEWLNELLFLTETEGMLFVEYAIKSLSEDELQARVGGARAAVTEARLKAATFHNLELRQTESGWSAEITFDV